MPFIAAAAAAEESLGIAPVQIQKNAILKMDDFSRVPAVNLPWTGDT